MQCITNNQQIYHVGDSESASNGHDHEMKIVYFRKETT